MSMYETFAEVYDAFMDNIPYEEWGMRIHSILRAHNIADGTILDLGCGTGTLTELFASYGYDMVGVDASVDMLMVAQDKRMESGADILYLQQDMRELDLGMSVKAVICACDTINYLENTEDLLAAFSRVKNTLDKDGIFIFDIKTLYLYRTVLADNTFAYNLDECAFIWDNFWDEDTKTNEYDLSLFLQEEEDLFRRFDEVHLQHAFSKEEILSALAQCGFLCEAVFDDYTDREEHEKSERLVFVARPHNG